jgi:hypothetical protein
MKYAVPDLLDLKDADIKINFKAERLAEVYVCSTPAAWQTRS